MLYFEALLRTALHIRMADRSSPEKTPRGYGTGFLLEYRNLNLFVTVEHLNKCGGQHFVESGKIVGGLQELLPIPTLNHAGFATIDPSGDPAELAEKIRDGSIIGDLDKLDVGFTEVANIPPLFQREIQVTEKVKIELGPKAMLMSSLEPTLDQHESFGFAGRVAAKDGGDALQDKIVTGLRSPTVNGRWTIFKLPRPIGSAAEFQGCSGAPILDSQGQLSGIVVGGRKGEDSLYAFNVRTLKYLIDLTYFPPSAAP